MIFLASLGLFFLALLGVRAVIKANRVIKAAEHIPGGKQHHESR